MASSPVSPKVRRAVFERDECRCQYCGVFCVDVNDLTVDHIVPISYGGTHKADNLRTACKSCNSGRRNESIDEFRFRQTMWDGGIGHILSTTQAKALMDLGIDLRLPTPHVFYFERACK